MSQLAQIVERLNENDHRLSFSFNLPEPPTIPGPNCACAASKPPARRFPGRPCTAARRAHSSSTHRPKKYSRALRRCGGRAPPASPSNFVHPSRARRRA